mgnify:CR=1 FL=1
MSHPSVSLPLRIWPDFTHSQHELTAMTTTSFTSGDPGDEPDEDSEPADRVVPPDRCRECSDDPSLTGLCIDCFLA